MYTITIASTNFLVHLVETLPELPNIDLSNPKITEAVVIYHLEKSYPFTVLLNNAHDFGDLDGAEYTRLRDKLRGYRQTLRRYLSPFRRTPPELIIQILKYAVPHIEIEDCTPGNNTVPELYCPQITVVARLSKRFHAIVHSQPQLFSSIILRRRITCGDHHPILPERISQILRLSASRPLDVTVELIDRGDISPSTPSTLPLSHCTSIDMLRTKPWVTFTYFGPSYVGAAAVTDHSLFPSPSTQSVTACLTALYLCRVTSLEKMLEALSSSAIPLEALYISAADGWETPDLTHKLQLPTSLQDLRIRGSSRTVICILRAASEVPSVSVTLVPGLDSNSATWQHSPGVKLAKPELLLQEPVALPRLSSFWVTDRDFWGHVGPDLFRSIHMPHLDTLILSWEHSSDWFNTRYLESLNQFLAQTPTIRHVYLINTPKETETHLVFSPFPECIIHRYCHRVSPMEWMEVRHATYEDSDSDEVSDTQSLSVASHGELVECTCPVDAVGGECPCYEPRYERPYWIRSHPWTDPYDFAA